MSAPIRVFADSKGVGQCSKCRAGILWATTVAGAKMPLEGNARPLPTELLPPEERTHNGRALQFFPMSASHWANCPNARDFKRKRPAHADRA